MTTKQKKAQVSRAPVAPVAPVAPFDLGQAGASVLARIVGEETSALRSSQDWKFPKHVSFPSHIPGAGQLVFKSREEWDLFVCEMNWFRTDREVPLDLLVKTAAALRGESTSDREAADKALRLIDTCARILEQSHSSKAQNEAIAHEMRALGLSTAKSTPFRKGIKLITGQMRPDRAEEDFLTFLEAYYRRMIARSWDETAFERSYGLRAAHGEQGMDMQAVWKKMISDEYARCEKEGFWPDELREYRWVFAKLRDEGHLGKKRFPTKKGLPSEKASTFDSKGKLPDSRKKKPAK